MRLNNNSWSNLAQKTNRLMCAAGLLALFTFSSGYTARAETEAEAPAKVELTSAHTSKIEDHERRVADLKASVPLLEQEYIETYNLNTGRAIIKERVVIVRGRVLNNMRKIYDINSRTMEIIPLSDPDKDVLTGWPLDASDWVALSYYSGEHRPREGYFPVAVELQNLRTGQILQLEGHEANVSTVLSIGQKVYTAAGRETEFEDGTSVTSADSNLREWDLETGKLLRSWLAPTPIHELQYHEQSNSFLVHSELIHEKPLDSDQVPWNPIIYRVDRDTFELMSQLELPRRVGTFLPTDDDEHFLTSTYKDGWSVLEISK